MIQSQVIQDILNQWESDTLEADSFYYRQEFKKASKVFCKTVELLEPWLEKDHKERKRIIRFFVLSCHNAAHVLTKQGKHKEAEYYYSHAHFRVLSLLGQCSKPTPSRILDGILLELRCTFKQLRAYLIGKNKIELAADVKEESARVIRQRYSDYADDIFKA